MQVSSAKATIKVDNAVLQKVEEALKAADVKPDVLSIEGTSVRARFNTPDEQLKAKDVIQKALIPDANDPAYIVALNLVSRSPQWLTAVGAKPMYLGLDLRGGVHFMLQVDMAAALTKKADSFAGDLRSSLRDKNIRHGGVSRNGNTVEIRVRDEAMLTAARNLVSDQFPDLAATSEPDGAGFKLLASIKPEALRKVQEQALKQNIVTLHNRINELGVAEPVIQQQGLDRIIVQLPGVQDTAKAKDILGRTATLEVRLVDESSGRAAPNWFGPRALRLRAIPGPQRSGRDRAKAGRADRREPHRRTARLRQPDPGAHGQPGAGCQGRTHLQGHHARERGQAHGHHPVRKGKGEVVTAPVIRTEIGGGRVQISGRMTTAEANDTALLLRAGSLAAPMEIIEEYTIGPSLGADNINRGIHSVVWGLVAIAAFMCVYYLLFGVISTVALSVNVLLLLAILSMLQATLTLPGIAAMALALGVAIDSNVLINERIREELRGGASPQAAIHAGYENAWHTILDSNVTTLIAGLALLAFGSGPVRGFAVVHCIGILTSMFSAVFFSRGLVNLWYGRRKKLKSISIGQVWKPEDTSQLRSVTAKGSSVADSGANN